jgi:excinuclease ABC subunit A
LIFLIIRLKLTKKNKKTLTFTFFNARIMPRKGSSNNKNTITIKGARVHNLKNVTVSIPRDRLIVITGLSGSGKSSLAFDTLYAEGQRRYVESLSAYARQFLGRMNKPEVDFISGIPPAIAIEQKVNTQNPRSTVGTSTEIYEYLKLLYARIGKTYSPVSNQIVEKHQVSDVVNYALSLPPKTEITMLAPATISPGLNLLSFLEMRQQQGFTRIEYDGQLIRIREYLKQPVTLNENKLFLVIDRFLVSEDPELANRISDSADTAFAEGNGSCQLKYTSGETLIRKNFSIHFEADGIEFEEPSEFLFSFNNPLGACPVCEGYGKVIGIDEDLVVPDKSLSVYDDAIACWKGEKMSKWKEKVILHAQEFNFPIHKSWYELSDEQKALIWKGNKWFRGLHDFFKHLEEKSYKVQYRVMLSRYRGKTTCYECHGSRLRKEASWVKVNDKSIQELVDQPIDKLYGFIAQLKITKQDSIISDRLVKEIKSRLSFMREVGLGYLTLNRLSSTLSGGESQRINLATSLGSSLVGSLYILDEPSIGLHPRDTGRLIKVLKNLKDMGNTVIVVEHDEEIIRAADEIIDIGPEAGRLGGEIVFQGSYKKLLHSGKSLTALYCSGAEKIIVPEQRRKWNSYIELVDCRENNLKGITVRIPLHILTAITGVSGSGKSSLVKGILYPALSRLIHAQGIKPGKFGSLRGDMHLLKSVELIDQNPIGKSSRSNPVTYIKAYDDIRKLFSLQNTSRINNFQPSHFSFNVDGGRCEECQGEGVIKVEMQFMADIQLTCESCQGKRFKQEILEVAYNGKNIHDVLEMTVEEAIDFFGKDEKGHGNRISEKLKPLRDVGLGYVRLGQSSSTLSGGESQRVKLASFLGKDKTSGQCLFVFDEPTTGLHFHDINKLMDSFQALIRQGHSILVVEHNPEVIKSADWVIDLGPEGGEAGGQLVAEGTPEEIAQNKNSYTGMFIREKLK